MGLSIMAKREISLMKSLKHENVMKIRGVFQDDLHICMVFDYYPCNLREHIQELKSAHFMTMEQYQLQSYARQLISAIAYCHAQQCLHRDIKPDNIMLSSDRLILKLTDFGMSRTCTGSGPHTDGCVTVCYRAPEIMLGDTHYGTPVDVWSAGCVLAEMINLQPAFLSDIEIKCALIIFCTLGTPDESTWPGVSKLPNFSDAFPKWPPQSAAAIIEPSLLRTPINAATGDAGAATGTAAAAGGAANACPGVNLRAAALLCNMLRLDPATRMSAAEALSTCKYLSESVPVDAAQTHDSGEDTPSEGARNDARSDDIVGLFGGSTDGVLAPPGAAEGGDPSPGRAGEEAGDMGTVTIAEMLAIAAGPGLDSEKVTGLTRLARGCGGAAQDALGPMWDRAGGEFIGVPDWRAVTSALALVDIFAAPAGAHVDPLAAAVLLEMAQVDPVRASALRALNTSEYAPEPVPEVAQEIYSAEAAALDRGGSGTDSDRQGGMERHNQCRAFDHLCTAPGDLNPLHLASSEAAGSATELRTELGRHPMDSDVSVRVDEPLEAGRVMSRWRRTLGDVKEDVNAEVLEIADWTGPGLDSEETVTGRRSFMAAAAAAAAVGVAPSKRLRAA